MKVTFSHFEPIADNITSFYFESESPMRYVAGQFIELTLPHKNPDKRGTQRWFTLSSSPTESGLAITTKRANPSSSFKKVLWGLKPGDKVEMSSPMGDFVLPKDKSKPLVFVAGGIGITPFHSMVKWLSDQNEKRSIQLIYTVHAEHELSFLPLFKSFDLELNVIVGQKITGEKIISLTNGLNSKQIYVSGPEPMAESLVSQLKELGLRSEQIIGDYFPNYESL